MKPDKTAIYEPHNESIRTGDGRHVRLRDLHRALMAINPYNLRRITTIAGIASGINDPMEAGQDEAVRDVIDLVRGMPQYCLPVIQAGLNIPAASEHFEELFRDRRFGTSEAPTGAKDAAPARRSVSKYADKVASFFWESREREGEFSYFIREDQRVLVLNAGQRFASDEPYHQCFVIVRTMHGRFFLKWPAAARQEPAWYHDAQGRVQWFFPAEEDFEELFPGYTYEAYGLQFSVPNIGTDYRAWLDDFEEEAPSLGQDEERAPDATAPGRVAVLLEIIEAHDIDIQTLRDLSKHFRQISNQYHPLKHLHASPEDKERINLRYLELTNAYNELKKHFS